MRSAFLGVMRKIWFKADRLGGAEGGKEVWLCTLLYNSGEVGVKALNQRPPTLELPQWSKRHMDLCHEIRL